MKMVYTNENLFLVGNAKNILEADGVEVIVKNEFAQGAIGEISAFDSWPQLWVLNDTDYEHALTIIKNASGKDHASEWICSNCNESNDASFEVCWKCQNESA